MLLPKITSRFQQGSSARDVATLTMGTVIAQGITIAVTPVLTRLYTPSDFGLLAVFLAVVSVGATFVTLRYETSILVPNANTESANLVLLSLILSTCLSLLLALLGTLLPSGLQKEVGLDALGNWLPIAFLTAGFTSALAVMQSWMHRQKKYKQMAWLRVGQSTTLAVLALLLGRANITNGLLIAQICAIFPVCLIALWLGRSAAHWWQKQKLQATAIKHGSSPKYLLPTALLDMVTLHISIVLIAAWFGKDEAGQLSMAWKILALPATLIGGAMSQVFFQKIASDVDRGRNFIFQLYIKISKFLGLISLAPILTISLYGMEIFSFLLGEQWSNSGKMAEWLIFSSMLTFVFSPTSSIFIVLGKQDILLFFSLIQAIYRSGILIIANNTMEYIQWLVLFEVINVIFFEITVIYFLLKNKKEKI